LRKLSISNCEIDKNSAKSLRMLLTDTSTISEISFFNTIITDEVGYEISLGLQKTLSVVHLSFVSNTISKKSLGFLIKALQNNKSIICLDFNSSPGLPKNKLQFSTSELCELCKNNKFFQFVNLQGNFIGDFGLKSFENNGFGNFIISLNISENNLTEKSIPIICDIIKNTKNLRELKLSNNPLGNEMLISLAKIIHEHLCLQRIFMIKCNFTCSGIWAFFGAKLHSMHLEKLIFDQNLLEGKGFSGIKKYFGHSHCKLKELSLKNCGLHNNEIKYMAHGINENNIHLINLNLENNIIRDEGTIQLFDSLCGRNIQLKFLDISHNKITVFFYVLCFQRIYQIKVFVN